VVVEQHTAEHFGLQPGDRVAVTGAGEVEVVGVGISTDQFRFDPVLRVRSVVAAMVLLTVCALVAQVAGFRRLDRLDLPAKVRERAL
jgi:hypothetical protein